MNRMLASALFGLLLPATGLAQLPPFLTTTKIWSTNISPTSSSLDASDPDGASGGRVNGLASVPGDNKTYYAASEWGGLFKSKDAGKTWAHLPGHVPTVTWHVKVDPGNVDRVYATSFYDGRVSSIAGINVSLDAGATWAKPATAVPPVGFCQSAARRDEPSAFGIAINPANTANVYVGTNCGLARSTDSGVTWNYVNPTGVGAARNIWDVVVHHGGTVDICGDDGHYRSTDGGTTWSTAAASPLPGGRCSIAASPDEAHVLFAVVGTSIYESDNGGQSWPVTYANPSSQGRIPFVEVNDRTGAAYDLWFGDVKLWRASCTTPAAAAPGGAARCNASAAWSGPYTRAAGAHDDSGAIAFDTQMANDRCPRIFSSDGGVFRNTTTASPACHTPAWEQPTVTPTALWNMAMSGVSAAGEDAEHLYHGNQDNGSFGTTNAGAATPTWKNDNCCDSFAATADSAQALTTICCYNPAPATRLFRSGPGLNPPTTEIAGPPGNLRAFQQLPSIANFGANSFIVLTTNGVYATTNAGAAAPAWSLVGVASPADACGVQIARSGADVHVFVKRGGCSGDVAASIWRHSGTGAAGAWTQVPNSANVGVYAVDPTLPDRMIASHLEAAGPVMRMTTDGGTTWTPLAQLDDLMTAGGVFRYRTTRGATAFTGFNGYPQPTLVAIDPNEGQNMVAGAADSGLFLSRNGGASWRLVSNPINPSAKDPHIPRPRYIHFDHDLPGLTLYVGTQGRGVWRVRVTKTSILCAQSPFFCGKIDLGKFTKQWEATCKPKCPPWWEVWLDRYDPAWKFSIVDGLGNEVAHHLTPYRGGVILSFRPAKADLTQEAMQGYTLLYETNVRKTPRGKLPFVGQLKTAEAFRPMR
ncbi:MAG: sialidase family protein [Rhodocyclaceae bacterium]|nr:sialidase family protein [Rhodocyclaceae bacterium]